MNGVRAQLREGKYTKWAAELTPDQFVGVLWLVGEFMMRAAPGDYNIDEYIGGERRKIAALKALANYLKYPLTANEVRMYIGDALRKGEKGAIQRELDDGNRALWRAHARSNAVSS